MRAFFVACLVLFAAAPAATLSQENTAEAQRYAFVPIEGGALRLDKESGEVSRCVKEGGKEVCRLLADERLAYQGAIERLSHRLDRLEKRLEAASAPVAAPEAEPKAEKPSPPPAAKNEPKLEEPSDEELDRFFALADQVMRRFFGMVKDLKRDFENDQL